MRPVALALILLLGLALAPGAAHAQSPAPCSEKGAPFLAAVQRLKETCRHPLCGTIHAPGRARAPSAASAACGGDPAAGLVHAAIDVLSSGGFLLMGEVHDNGVHHRLRAVALGLLQELPEGTADVGRAALVFEHIRADQQGALVLFAELARNGQHVATAGTLFRLLKWDQSGWPDKALFEPLFRHAITGRHAILAGDPPRERVRAVARGGMAALPDDERRQLRLDEPLAPRLNEALLGELEASHCGLVPRAAFTTMADAQRYRDAHLARAMVNGAGQRRRAILFSGNGHVRTDRGVPHALRLLAPERPVLAVALTEVDDARTEPAAYVPRDPDGQAAVDYLIFTPRVERNDPCVEMRERFGKKR